MRPWILAAFFCAAAAQGRAAATPSQDLQEYEDSLSRNLSAAAGFLAENSARGLAFATGAQAFSPVEARGLGHFNVGLSLGLGATPIDKTAAREAASNAGSDVNGYIDSLPAALPLPLGGLNVHAGLPGFLLFKSTDLGARLGGYRAASNDGSLEVASGGLEFRGNVFEAGLSAPLTLTLGLSVDRLTTQVRSLSQPQSFSSTYNGYTRSGSYRHGLDLDGEALATALKASVSRSFLFLTPYGGLSLVALHGQNTLRSYETGTVTSTGPGGSATADITVEGRSTQPLASLELRAGAGLEIGLGLVYLAFGVEGGAVSKGIAAHGQFGVKF